MQLLFNKDKKDVEALEKREEDGKASNTQHILYCLWETETHRFNLQNHFHQ